MSTARWYEKANAYSEAWQDLHPNVIPKTASVALGLAVAQAETLCGDAWAGEHNWGAVTSRALTAPEKGIIAAAGIKPVVEPRSARLAAEAAARAALADAAAAGRIADPGPSVALHADSSSAGPYFTFFAAFHEDVDGARYFIRTLTRTSSELHDTVTGAADALAADMYAAGYFKGTHDPRKLYPDPRDPDSQVLGGVLNVREYATRLDQLQPTILRELADWTPGTEPPVYTEPAGPPDLSSIAGVQRALNMLGQDPALDEDGLPGPKTAAAVEAFQLAHGLKVDGVVGPATEAALHAALA